jgi:hypothetical protein
MPVAMKTSPSAAPPAGFDAATYSSTGPPQVVALMRQPDRDIGNCYIQRAVYSSVMGRRDM